MKIRSGIKYQALMAESHIIIFVDTVLLLSYICTIITNKQFKHFWCWTWTTVPQTIKLYKNINKGMCVSFTKIGMTLCLGIICVCCWWYLICFEEYCGKDVTLSCLVKAINQHVVVKDVTKDGWTDRLYWEYDRSELQLNESRNDGMYSDWREVVKKKFFFESI